MRLQDDVLRHVLEYVGPRNYVFIAAVCRQWKHQYGLLHHGRQAKVTSLSSAASSLSTMILYKQQASRNPKWSHTCYISRIVGESGDLRMVQWLLARNHRQTFSSTRLMGGAAYGGHLGMVKWLRAIAGDHWACAWAARNGHVGVLKWLKANGCDWGDLTCCFAAERGHLEVLKWARANGCPWSREECIRGARRSGHGNVVQWIESIHDDEAEAPR